MPRNILIETAVICLLYSIHVSYGHHFYMATINWKVVPGTARSVIFEFSAAWDLAVGYCGGRCTTADIGTMGGAGGLWRCNTTTAASCTSMFALLQGWIIGMNIADNWNQDANSFVYNFTGNGPFYVEFKDNPWGPQVQLRSSATLSRSYRIATEVLLGNGSDTGLPNSSPRTTALPVYRVHCGCTGGNAQTISLAISDADGDVVRCRFSTIAEAGDSAYSLPQGTASNAVPGLCNINFDLANSNYYCNGSQYVVAISIEDFPRSTITLNGRTFTTRDALSVVQLVFMVQLFPLVSAACTTPPTWVSPTPASQSIVYTAPYNVFSLSFHAQSASSTNITSIDASLPGGNITLVLPDSLGRASVSMATWTWTPTASDQNQIIGICAIATDTRGKAGSQRCFYVIVNGTRTIPTTSLTNNTIFGASGTSPTSVTTSSSTVLVIALSSIGALLAAVAITTTVICCIKAGAAKRRKVQDEEEEEEQREAVDSTQSNSNGITSSASTGKLTSTTKV